jgi:translation initiation factor 2 gamma subunit (eIF-2gamma)
MSTKCRVNVGTIGHIDHGKTTLREALGMSAYTSALEDARERLPVCDTEGLCKIADMYVANSFGKGK